MSRNQDEGLSRDPGRLVKVCLFLSQGCASWKWYFPFHYAPFASDFKDIKGMFTEFEKGTKPVRTSLHLPPLMDHSSNRNLLFQFKPLEQLMGVFPAASGNFLPPTWRDLMSSPVRLGAAPGNRAFLFLHFTFCFVVGFLHHRFLP